MSDTTEHIADVQNRVLKIICFLLTEDKKSQLKVGNHEKPRRRRKGRSRGSSEKAVKRPKSFEAARKLPKKRKKRSEKRPKPKKGRKALVSSQKRTCQVTDGHGNCLKFKDRYRNSWGLGDSTCLQRSGRRHRRSGRHIRQRLFWYLINQMFYIRTTFIRPLIGRSISGTGSLRGVPSTNFAPT
jgi:hypothetical protein